MELKSGSWPDPNVVYGDRQVVMTFKVHTLKLTTYFITTNWFENVYTVRFDFNELLGINLNFSQCKTGIMKAYSEQDAQNRVDPEFQSMIMQLGLWIRSNVWLDKGDDSITFDIKDFAEKK